MRNLPILIALAVVVAHATSPPATDNVTARVLDIQAICMGDKQCRVKISTEDASGDHSAVTTFRANRVDSTMKYIKGEEYGSFDHGRYALMWLDTPVVLDDSGTMRPPRADDPPKARLTFTSNVGIDPRGCVTFFYGYVHGPAWPVVLQSYLWGYPPTTTKEIGSIGGPRSPSVRREPPPKRVVQGGAALRFQITADEHERCRVAVLITRGNRHGTAVTHFRANRVGEDMRYFPREREGGTDLLTGGGTYLADLPMIVDERGMRRPKAGDPRENFGTLTATIALDDRGHVTFFYGFVKDGRTSSVRRFLLWGYSTETLMLTEPKESSRAKGARRGDM